MTQAVDERCKLREILSFFLEDERDSWLAKDVADVANRVPEGLLLRR